MHSLTHTPRRNVADNSKRIYKNKNTQILTSLREEEEEKKEKILSACPLTLLCLANLFVQSCQSLSLCVWLCVCAVRQQQQQHSNVRRNSLGIFLPLFSSSVSLWLLFVTHSLSLTELHLPLLHQALHYTHCTLAICRRCRRLRRSRPRSSAPIFIRRPRCCCPRHYHQPASFGSHFSIYWAPSEREKERECRVRHSQSLSLFCSCAQRILSLGFLLAPFSLLSLAVQFNAGPTFLLFSFSLSLSFFDSGPSLRLTVQLSYSKALPYFCPVYYICVCSLSLTFWLNSARHFLRLLSASMPLAFSLLSALDVVLWVPAVFSVVEFQTDRCRCRR